MADVQAMNILCASLLGSQTSIVLFFLCLKIPSVWNFPLANPFEEGSNEKTSHESTEWFLPYKVHCCGIGALPPEPGKFTSHQKVQRSWDLSTKSC